jgi:4-methoxybenzoate monooxygenase (O-demethylating)
VSTVVSTDIDPFSREYFIDPWPHLAAMRSAAPAVWLSKYGIWGVAGHADVTTVFRDHETFCSGAGVGLSDFRKEAPWRPPSIILEADPPEHTKARKVLADVLSPVNVKAMQEVFDRDAQIMVSALVNAGTVDGITQLSEAYPLKVFPDAVGVTPRDRHHLLAYGNMVFNLGRATSSLIKACSISMPPELGSWPNAHDQHSLPTVSVPKSTKQPTAEK